MLVGSKEVNTVPYQPVRLVYICTGQYTGTDTPMFCIEKITDCTSCVPTKIDRTNVIRLFWSVNENNENSDEKNEKQGYPFENPDEKSEKQGRVL